MGFFTHVGQDLRSSWRSLRGGGGSSATAVAVLAIGIGANAAMFSVVNRVLLEPLPYPEPDRLVQLLVGSPMGNATLTSVPKYVAWRETRGAFRVIAAFGSIESVALGGGDRPELAAAMRVSADYRSVFGMRLVRGRTFTRAEDVPGGPRVALISVGSWRRRFGGDPTIVGRTLIVEQEAYELIGVVDPVPGPGAGASAEADVWLPLRADPNSLDHASRYQVVARLDEGVTLEMARRQMYEAAGEFHRKFPGAMGPLEHFTLAPLRDVLVGDARFAVLLLSGAVTFVLLIACANVANLLLAQGRRRAREIAVRASLGASPRRIIGQLLTESLLLSLVGGVAGLALGAAGIRALLAMNPGNIPFVGADGAGIALDWRVLLFTGLATLATGLLFGILPALHASRIDLIGTLRGADPQASGGPRDSRIRASLVIAQMSFAVVLLVGAGLLIRTFVASRIEALGFEAHDVLAMEMPLSGPRFARTADVARLVRAGEQRLETLPAVAAAAVTCALPLEPTASLPFTIDRRPLASASYHGLASWRSVSLRYFDVFRIALLRGRTFTIHDHASGEPVAIINDAMARKYWPDGNALQERLTIGRGIRPEIAEPTRTIVGIVRNARDGGLHHDPEPMVYVPVPQVSDGMNAFNNQVLPLQWVIRTTGAADRSGASIERELRAISGGLPIGRVRSMDEVIAQSTARADFNTTVLTLFAAIALSLAAIGLYGVIAYSVQQRTREIGVRVALGAAPGEVRGMVLLQGLRLTLAGLLVGAVVALILTRSMTSLIFGVKTWDPIVFTAVAVLLVAVALAATLLPAHRATRIHPNEALRHV